MHEIDSGVYKFVITTVIHVQKIVNSIVFESNMESYLTYIIKNNSILRFPSLDGIPIVTV